jgi:hypothetical protein
MSDHSYDSVCPKCGKSMDSYSHNRPYDMVYHSCLNCGFYTENKEKRLNLEGLNQDRLEYYERFPCEKHQEGDPNCKDCKAKSQLKELPTINEEE